MFSVRVQADVPGPGSSLLSMFRGMGIEPAKTWGRGAPALGKQILIILVRHLQMYKLGKYPISSRRFGGASVDKEIDLFFHLLSWTRCLMCFCVSLRTRCSRGTQRCSITRVSCCTCSHRSRKFTPQSWVKGKKAFL